VKLVQRNQGLAGDAPKRPEIGLLAATSIGVGGMIGAGIFSILGVVAGLSGAAMALSFALGGVVAGFAAYGYAALGKTFPSVGGAVTFLVRGYGPGVISGSLNVFQYFSYIITIALYATGFAAYAATFIGLPVKAWAVGVVVAFTAINFLGARAMGRTESVIVAAKVSILVLFIVAAFVALPGPGLARLSPGDWPGLLSILSGAGLLFVGYEGFGLITNAATNMRQPKRDLPRAIYSSVAIVTVLYVLVAIGVVTNVPPDVLKRLGDSALAVAAKPSLGQAGFRLVAIAALLSTASAVNATLFGSANIAYQVSKNGSLPSAFGRERWGRDVEGLFITAAFVLVFVLIFPLRSVASMGSAAFLLIYAAVSIGHMRIRAQTGARAWAIATAAITTITLLIVLLYNMINAAPTSAIGLGVTLTASFLFETAYRRRSGRTLTAILAETEPGSITSAPVTHEGAAQPREPDPRLTDS
jgi:amino acid transporter